MEKSCSLCQAHAPLFPSIWTVCIFREVSTARVSGYGLRVSQGCFCRAVFGNRKCRPATRATGDFHGLLAQEPNHRVQYAVNYMFCVACVCWDHMFTFPVLSKNQFAEPFFQLINKARLPALPCSIKAVKASSRGLLINLATKLVRPWKAIYVHCVVKLQKRGLIPASLILPKSLSSYL